MPRLPGSEALGGLPSMNSGARVPQVSGRNPVAEAAGNLGQGLVALSSEQREREDALQAAGADARLTTGLTELRRKFDTDPDWQTHQPRFSDEANRILEEAAGMISNQRVRDRWLLRAGVAVSNAFDHVVGRQDRLRGEHEYDRIDNTLGQLGSSYVRAPDDATRDTIRRNMEDTIELGRRTGVISADRLRDLTQRHLHGAVEADVMSRPDSYAALLELREGDQRVALPSSGEISELGLSRLQSTVRRPGMTPAQIRKAEGDLRSETAAISGMLREDLKNVDLTQAQHDALVSFGVARGRDALRELIPLVQSEGPGRLESLSQAMRTRGGLTAQEQPSLADESRVVQRGNLDAAHRALNLTPQEQAFYERHLSNLYGRGGFDQPGGARSTVLGTTVEIDGRTYLLPTVFDGKQLKPGTPEFRAAIEASGGPDAFPSYATREEADSRYKKIHEYMERDTEAYQRGRGQGQPSGDGAAAERIGSVSARYESGGRGVGFISSGRGDPGGPSYGVHQLSGVQSMPAFLRSPEGEPYRAEFGGAQPMTPEFNRVYRRVAERDPEGFAAAQHAFYSRTHYEPARQTAQMLGFDVSNRAIQEALFSIGVQHGGAATVIERAAQQLGPNASVEDQVRSLYDARTKYVEGLSSLPEETRQSVLDRYRREERDVIALARGGTRVAQRTGDTTTDVSPAGDDPRVDEYADLVSGRAPSSRYSGLPVDRRRVLIGKLEQALRHDLMKDMDDDLDTVRRTGSPNRLPDGTTSFSRAARVLTRNQFSNYQTKLEEAQAQYRALYGLQDLTPDERNRRRDQISRTEGQRPSITRRVLDMFDAAADRMREEGEKDGAQSVEGGIPLRRIGTHRRETMGPDGQPVLSSEIDIDHRLAPAREVVEAHASVRRRHDGRLLNIGTNENGALVIQRVEEGQEGIAAQQDAWRRIIDARLDAQARRGIAERFRTPITRAEGEELLNMPRRVADQTEFRNLMAAAVDRAYERYGPYARQALDAAIRFRSGMDKDEAAIAGSMVRSMVQGTGVRAEEINRLTRSLQLSREQQAWLGGGDFQMEGVGSFRVPGGPQPRAPEPPRNMWQRMTGGGGQAPDFSRYTAPTAPVPTPRAAGPGTSVAWPKPRPEEIQYLAEHPEIWRVFAKKYGLEATRQYLQGLPQP